MKPDFIGIGVPKAGTTSLHHYLRQHPEISMSRDKEPHYFVHADGERRWTGPGDDVSTQNDVHDWETYQQLFDEEGHIAGEFSPQYLADPAVPARIKARLPDVRFIALLRDPVERAYSNYLHMRRRHRERVSSFERALRKEDERLAAGWEPFWGYRHQSMYGQNFLPWLKAFPKDRFLVLTLRDLRQRPQETMERVHDFLGVGPHTPDFLVYNPGGIGRVEPLQKRLLRKNPFGGVTRYVLPAKLRFRLHLALRRLNSKYPPIKPSVEARLRREFLPDIEDLEEQFGLDLGFWKPK